MNMLLDINGNIIFTVLILQLKYDHAYLKLTNNLQKMKRHFISLITTMLLFNIGFCQIYWPAKQLKGSDTKSNSVPKKFNLSQVNNYGNFTSNYYLNSFKIPIDSQYKLDSIDVGDFRRINFEYDLINHMIKENVVSQSQFSNTIMKYDGYGNVLDFNQTKSGWASFSYKIFHNDINVDSVIMSYSDIDDEGEIWKTSFAYQDSHIIKREDEIFSSSNVKMFTDYVEDYYYEDGKLDSVKISEYNSDNDKWVYQIYDFKYNSNGFIKMLSHKNNYRGYWIYYLIIRNNYENDQLKEEIIESKRFYDQDLEKEKYEYIYNSKGKVALANRYDSIDVGWNKISYTEFSYLENVSNIYVPPLSLIDPTESFFDIFSPIFIEPIYSSEYKFISDGVSQLKGFVKSDNSGIFEFAGEQLFYYSPVNFNLKTSANQRNNLYDAKIFPNPTVNGVINVTGILGDVKSTINLYDVSGTLWKSWNIFGQNTSMDVSCIPNGIYIVKVINDSHSFTKKIIIQNQ